MADGAVARRTGTAGAFGAKLDTAADFVLVAVCLAKLLPAVRIPACLIVWIILIAAIKAANLMTGYVTQREMVALHTGMNKATGILLFSLPLTVPFFDVTYSGAFVSAAATFAAIQEGRLIRAGAKT